MRWFGRRRRRRPEAEASGQPLNPRLAKLVFYAGIGALCGFFYFTVFRANQDALRLVAPGRAELQLAKAGEYTIFHEYRSEVDGVGYDSSFLLEDVDVRVTDQATGQPVPLRPARRSDKYTTFSGAGYSIYDFTVERPGAYLLECDFLKDMPQAVLAVSTGFGQNVILIVIVTFAIVILTGGLTVALVFLPGKKK